MTYKTGEIAVCFLAGAALGTIYFTGLWWTVRKVPSAQNPALLSLGSFLLRTALVLGGFYSVMGGQWQRLMVCLLGFLAARVVLVRRLRAGRPGKGVMSAPGRRSPAE